MKYAMNKYWPLILFAADDGTGNGEGGNTGEGGDGGTDEGASNDGAGELYRPDGLDENFHGENDRETIDKLMAGIKDASPVLPEDITGYEYTPADELKDYFGEKMIPF